MIEKITDLPDNVLGFTAKGAITGHDYETVLLPAVDEILSRCDKVRFLYHLGDDFTVFDAGAMWDDTKLGLKHFNDWEKIAIVSDIGWVATSIKVFGHLIPGEFRIFANSELLDAKKWISE